MEIRRRHIIFIILGMVLLALDLFIFRVTPWFVPLLIISILIGASQFLIDFFSNLRRKRELEERFPDFIRNLVGAIKSGMPAPKAILQVSKEDYGALNPHVKKLANQIEWAIPFHKAFMNFADGTNNKVIRRAVETVIEAEVAGGHIEDVLSSVTDSVIKIKKIREKRRAAINSQVIQTYIIFVIFLIVMVIIQNFLMPFVAGMNQATTLPISGELGEEGVQLTETNIESLMVPTPIRFNSPAAFFDSLGKWLVSMRGVFVMMVLIQGTFAGLVLGKLAEGDMASGIKHSLMLVIMGILFMTLAQGFL